MCHPPHKRDLKPQLADDARRLAQASRDSARGLSLTAAERQMGEMLAATERVKPGQRGGRTKKDGTRSAPSNAPPTLADMGVTKKESARAQKVAELPRVAYTEPAPERATTPRPLCWYAWPVRRVYDVRCAMR